jgi:hypothetical protein
LFAFFFAKQTSLVSFCFCIELSRILIDELKCRSARCCMADSGICAPDLW